MRKSLPPFALAYFLPGQVLLAGKERPHKTVPNKRETMQEPGMFRPDEHEAETRPVNRPQTVNTTPAMFSPEANASGLPHFFPVFPDADEGDTALNIQVVALD